MSSGGGCRPSSGWRGAAGARAEPAELTGPPAHPAEFQDGDQLFAGKASRTRARPRGAQEPERRGRLIFSSPPPRFRELVVAHV